VGLVVALDFKRRENACWGLGERSRNYDDVLDKKFLPRAEFIEQFLGYCCWN
jgi:hypothetical protein